MEQRKSTHLTKTVHVQIIDNRKCEAFLSGLHIFWKGRNGGKFMDCKKAQSLVTSYITRKLNDKDLEEFLEHVNTCDECYEELEIYYTVHYTLERLDQDGAAPAFSFSMAVISSSSSQPSVTSVSLFRNSRYSPCAFLTA